MRLPVALGLLGSCVFLGAQSIKVPQKAGPSRHGARQKAGAGPALQLGGELYLSWWLHPSRTQWLDIAPFQIKGAKDATAIVTHAGKNDQEFIDMAVMLAISLKRHVPAYPRIAIGVQGMTQENQDVLKRAGWQLLLVEDWNAPTITNTLADCGDLCADDKFFWRWQDAMEKLNIFRIPVRRVLFLDADTYVMSDKLSLLLEDKSMPEDHIAMAPDGCHEDFNSGVMMFKPDVDKFKEIVTFVGGVMVGNMTKRHDQPIINSVYKGKVTPLDKKYNCMNPTGRTSIAPCAQGCNETVVAHFTGLPKPATADTDMLDIVRKPHSAIMHCFMTNHGSCNVWPEFYCDLEGNKGYVTKKLRKKVSATGKCCHSPRRKTDPPECHDECPVQMRLSSDMDNKKLLGLYNLSSIVPDKIQHAGRPIYVGPGNVYMYYIKKKLNWAIGPNYTADSAAAYTHKRVACPTLAVQWKALDKDVNWVPVKTTLTAVNDPNITEDMQWDIATRLWVKAAPTDQASAPAAPKQEPVRLQRQKNLLQLRSKESAPRATGKDKDKEDLLLARRWWAD